MILSSLSFPNAVIGNPERFTGFPLKACGNDKRKIYFIVNLIILTGQLFFAASKELNSSSPTLAE